ncbi:MAG: helix-turn-helix domain-containing protein [Planctomycetes bacterium]|nr:helix-turn-helix domain-containing protein [Planctomycetota bacterium]
MKTSTAPSQASRDPNRLLSIREAAEFLGISDRLLWTLADNREVPSLRIGRRRLFRRAALIRWIAERENDEADE